MGNKTLTCRKDKPQLDNRDCGKVNIPKQTTIIVTSGLAATNRYRSLQQQIVLLFKALQLSFGFLAKNSSCSPGKAHNMLMPSHANVMI